MSMETHVVGARVRIPTATLGHDRHKPSEAFTVEAVYTTGGSVSYKLKGSPSIWPHSRVRRVL